MEKLFYEAKPFLYVYGSFAGYELGGSRAATCFAVLLSLCAGMILYWRFQARQYGKYEKK